MKRINIFLSTLVIAVIVFSNIMSVSACDDMWDYDMIGGYDAYEGPEAYDSYDDYLSYCNDND